MNRSGKPSKGRSPIHGWMNTSMGKNVAKGVLPVIMGTVRTLVLQEKEKKRGEGSRSSDLSNKPGGNEK